MNVLITGSRGYVGNRLCQIINKSYKNKIEIIGLDSNLYQFKKKLEKKIIIKDVRDIRLSDLKNIDSIIHLASLSNDPLGFEDSKTSPLELQYLKIISLFFLRVFIVFSSAKNLPSPCAIGILITFFS